MAELILTESDAVDEDAPRVYPTIPANEVLEAEILDVEIKDSWFNVDDNDPSLGKKPEVSFKFKITEEGEYEGAFIWGSTSTIFSTHPDCKLRLWVEEILGVDEGLPVDFQLDTEHLVGQSVRVVVSNYWSKKHNKDMHKVGDLMRIPSSAYPAERAF